MRRLHRIGVWIFVLVLGVALGKVGPYLFLSFTGDCSFRNTIRSIRHHATLRSRIAELSRLIAHNKKICDGFALYSTPAGHFWVPREDELSLPLELAEQELGIYQTNDVSVQPGDVVLDCGAHFGVYTRKALALGARLVVAIEPSPESIECLRRNLCAEVQAGRVTIYAKGVADKEEKLTLRRIPGFSAGDSVFMQKNRFVQGPSVPMTTIDNIVAELNLERVDFIKMDIEGAEQKALAGAAQVLSRFHPRLAISVYHNIDDVQSIPPLVRKAWIEYQAICGICGFESGRFQSEFLFFH